MEYADLLIVGAGAAGLMAAAEAGRLGLKTLLLEGQSRPGAKILMSGGGRCNATNIKVTEHDYATEGPAHVVRHVLEGFSPDQAFHFFDQWGAPLVLEQDGKYFSADNEAKTVLAALLRAQKAGGAEILYGRRVTSVAADKGGFNAVAAGELFSARSLLIATGGLSYPATGSDGAGYRLAASFGHKPPVLTPALTPLRSGRNAFGYLKGVAVPCRLTLWAKTRKVRACEGPLLFTHTGFSGPAVFDMSRHWKRAQDAGGAVLTVDFFPQLKKEGLGLEGLSPEALKKTAKNFMIRVLPERLALTLLKEAGIDTALPLGGLSKEKKKRLERVARAFPLDIEGVFGYDKAEVTSGGIDLNELKGASLESRLQPGLFFAGEILDVDGRVGGFNLHWAWASGVAVARSAAKKLNRG
jgi:predicted Rossmann fold flavoprotein